MRKMRTQNSQSVTQEFFRKARRVSEFVRRVHKSTSSSFVYLIVLLHKVC